MKVCRKCNIEKDGNEFPKNKVTKDRLGSWCKQCNREIAKEYRKSDSYKKVKNEYAKSDKGKETRKKYTKTEKFINYRKQYSKSEKYKQYHREYTKTEKYKTYRKRYLEIKNNSELYINVLTAIQKQLKNNKGE